MGGRRERGEGGEGGETIILHNILINRRVRHEEITVVLLHAWILVSA